MTPKPLAMEWRIELTTINNMVSGSNPGAATGVALVVNLNVMPTTIEVSGVETLTLGRQVDYKLSQK